MSSVTVFDIIFGKLRSRSFVHIFCGRNNCCLERTISDPNTALLKLKSFEGKIKFSEDVAKDLEGVSTEYVFFAEDHFDFDPKEANLERMIREAENQNADVVAGKGHKFYQPITEFLRPWFLT